MMDNKANETLDLKGIIVKYLHHWKFFLIAFVFSFIPAILYLNFYPRTYSFNMAVKLQKEEGMSMSAGFSQMSGLMQSFGLGTSGGLVKVDDEIAMMSSNRLLRLMIAELGLNIEYIKPFTFYKMYRDAPLQLTTDAGVIENLNDAYFFKVSVHPNQVKVKFKSKSGEYKGTYTFASLPAQIKIGADVFVIDYNPNTVVQETSFQLNIRCIPLGWVAEDIGKILTIEEMSNISDVLELKYIDHSLERGRNVLNTLIAKYNEEELSYKAKADNKTLEFVNQRIDSLIDKLKKVEFDIQEYKTINEMTLIEADVTMYSETMMGLQTKIIEVETQAYMINMQDSYIKDPANKYKIVPPFFSLIEGENSAVAQYNQAILDREQLQKNANEQNPIFQDMDDKVEALRNAVFLMIENAQKGTALTLSDLKAKEKAILAKMKTVPVKERDYIELRRSQEILQGLYLLLLQKQEETVLSLNDPTEPSRIIDPAFASKKIVGPRRLFAAIGMLVLTLVIPIGGLLIKDIFVSIKEEYKRG